MRKTLAALVLLAAPATAHAAPCTGPICNFDTLAPYFARLAMAGDARGLPPVHIVQIGDSHTAGDALTGAWRDLLQARWGNGGRGVLPPGRPYDGYLTRGITAAMSPDWSIAATFGKGAAESPGQRRPPLGLASYSLTALRPGAAMGLTADPAMPFDRVILCAMAGPTAGTLAVRIGAGNEQRLDFAADIVTPRCQTIRTATVQSVLRVTALDRPVTITSWATFHDDGGVAVSNLGVVGAQLMHFGRTDDAVIAEELTAYTPDLIVLAFGTNEGFAPRFDAAAYEVTLRAQIDRIRTLAGAVPILLLGAPDALSRNPALRTNAPGVLVGCSGGLFAPPALGDVRAVQRKVAGDLDIAFWDWQARMGGQCTAARWVASDPPRMRPDHVHFRTPGGVILARLLQDDLDHAMEGQ
ncbi:GDSL-type esterase/lipase family protein [Sphingomonas sp. ERG5]|uniref:GDSL-type esterase/lipase family protein n=1 Tax=Sphingomonas sp. ERG5 TaxID=1381597 RepID=UPI00054B5042|nr:GDSL-type esterase/lipase family protein [Sphingomonas sp. ERG5]